MNSKLIIVSILIAYNAGQISSKNSQQSGDGILKADPFSNGKGAGNSVYFTTGLPKTFDAREKWPKCPSIGYIFHQGNCRSSYAIAVASSVSDRICIHSDGAKNPVMSAQHIMSCCYLCGFGCDGGSQFEAWDFYRRHGFVSGGDFNSSQGCQPYSIPPCKLVRENPTGQTCTTYDDVEATPKCETKCRNQNHDISFRSDIHKGYYYPVYPYLAMKEIFEKGPITTQFYMYEDLIDYKSGVYQYDEKSDTEFFNLQTVKIIGWGEENGILYWLVVNSFGPDWGDNGTFKISRGNDGCYFQEKMYAGLPL